MAILVGFHVEGNDYLVLHAFVARILQLPEETFKVDFIDAPGRGWQFVLDFLPKALNRFYNQCAQFAVIGVDNDGDIDLDTSGLSEDPAHPRHSNHIGGNNAKCRHCSINQMIARARPNLNWIPKKPGATWPIIIAVPVEMIETWLLMRQGNLGAQRRRRSVHKQTLYGKPVATREDVINIALPLIRSMTPADIAGLNQASPSFQDFHDQLIGSRASICGPTDCW